MEDKVSKIFLERILKQVAEEDKLPWEKPFEGFYAFNYLTMAEYTGINRWVLPAGEYMTENQLRTYNKSNGTAYLFQKGIKWFPVLFSKEDARSISYEAMPADIQNNYKGKDGFLGYEGIFYYICKMSIFYKCKRIKRYSLVADIHHFADKDGNSPPSKIETGVVIMKYSKPESIIEDYVRKEGIKITHMQDGGYYMPFFDSINIPDINLFKSSNKYYSTWFHELIHSTGSSRRLNRVGVSTSKDKRDEQSSLNKEHSTKNYTISREECIAELGCALLCNETGVTNESLSNDAYRNHVAYIQGWIKYFKSNTDDIIYIMSQAEKAYTYVMKKSEVDVDDGSTPIE